MARVLEVENVTMQFGGVVAVNNLSMVVNEGEIVALIGPNGAGKTTAFNVITGVYQPTNGRVAFREETIIRNHPQGRMKKLYKGEIGEYYTKERVLAPTPDYITSLGMARTFQNIRLWKTQTVFDNVLIAKHHQSRHGFLSAMLRLNRDEEKAQRERVRDLLEIVFLRAGMRELSLSLALGVILDLLKVKTVDERFIRRYLYCTGWTGNGRPITRVCGSYQEARREGIYVYRDHQFTHERIDQMPDRFLKRSERDWAWFHTYLDYQLVDPVRVCLVCHTGKVDITSFDQDINLAVMRRLTEVQGGVITLQPIRMTPRLPAL